MAEIKLRMAEIDRGKVNDYGGNQFWLEGQEAGKGDMRGTPGGP
jgi:hypothetical protein